MYTLGKGGELMCNGLYKSSSVFFFFGSFAPITIRSVWKKSFTALPSLRNSGFEPIPKSTVASFPDSCSRTGCTTLLVVPGRTVLLTITVWYFFLTCAFPILCIALMINRRSLEPSVFLGCPHRSLLNRFD